MADTAAIDAAIAALRASDAPNISATAREFGIDRSRLSKLFNGVRTVRDTYITSMRFLSPEQDKRLLDIVVKLTRDGLPPTPKMVRQFALDISGKMPGKNWPKAWLDSHKEHMKNGYLRGFDLARKKADSLYQYRAYFELVITPSSYNSIANKY
jgi:hypothetical protein